MSYVGTHLDGQNDIGNLGAPEDIARAISGPVRAERCRISFAALVAIYPKAPFGGRAESDRAGRGNGPLKSRAAKGCKKRTNVLGCDA